MSTTANLRSIVGVGAVLLGLSMGDVGVAATCASPPSPGDARGFSCQTQAQSFDDPVDLFYGPTCTDVVTAFPNVTEREPEQDERVMCPYTRMVHRLGALPNAGPDDGAWQATPAQIGGIYSQFGTDLATFTFIAQATTAGQLRKAIEEVDITTDLLDVYRLYDVAGVSHDCGFTFSLGATTIEPQIIGQTIWRLWQLSRPSGRVTIENLYQVQLEACKRDYQIHLATGIPVKNQIDEENQTLIPIESSVGEVKLIFSYCGGVDNGYVLVSDVARILNARMPEHKTKYSIESTLINEYIANPVVPEAALLEV